MGQLYTMQRVGIFDQDANWELTVKGMTYTDKLGVGKLMGVELDAPITIDGVKFDEQAIGWLNPSGGNNVGHLWMSTCRSIRFITNNTSRMIIGERGNVGIGTMNPANELEVNGTIRAKEILVEANNWPDYVFENDYALPSLNEVSAHIKENKHLPGIPSAKEIEEKGVSLGEMNNKLLHM